MRKNKTPDPEFIVGIMFGILGLIAGLFLIALTIGIVR